MSRVRLLIDRLDLSQLALDHHDAHVVRSLVESRLATELRNRPALAGKSRLHQDVDLPKLPAGAHRPADVAAHIATSLLASLGEDLA